MKGILKSIVTIFTLTLMFTIFGTSMVSASVTAHKTIEDVERGNYEYTGRDSDTFLVEKNEKITVNARVEFLVDPNTSGSKITTTTSLRQYHWYGHSTLDSGTLFSNSFLPNPSDNFCTYIGGCYMTADTSSDGKYYVIVKTTGASDAYYGKYRFYITYTVGD